MPRRSQTCDINKDRALYGEYHHLFKQLKKYPEKFKQYTRMNLTTFDYILSKIGPEVKKIWCNLHSCPILPEERLVLTIRFFVTGLSFTQLSLTFRMGTTTVKDIIKETMDDIWNVLSPIHMSVPSHDDFLRIADEFYLKWGMPHCLGAIDGRHVRIKKPPNSHSLYYNYKRYHSVVYQAVVDANYKYMFIDVGAFGSQSDGGVYRNSEFKQALDQNFLDIPTLRHRSNQDIQVPYYFVGDGAYPLSSNMMKPFPGANLERTEVLFNKHLSRARAVVENTFGHTCQKWQIFYTTIGTSPEIVNKIIKSTCVLNNVIIDKEGSQPIELTSKDTDNIVETALYKEPGVAENNLTGKQLRERLMHYFCNN